MTSCFTSRSISSIRSTSKVALEPFSQTDLAAAFGTTPRSASAVVGMRLDLEPDAELGLGRPDGDHFGAAVTGDHESTLPREGYAPRGSMTGL